MISNDNGYGQRKVPCHDEEQVKFETECVDYVEETCYTQNNETCKYEKFKNCTGVIEAKMERQCFDVHELVCGLQEKLEYFTLQEDYQVQLCSVVKDRICDTTYDIDVNTRDDFQCCNLEYEHCEDKDAVLNDVTCKKTVEFQCRKEKRTNGGYGKETICDKVPKENCYDTPRTVSIYLPRFIWSCLILFFITVFKFNFFFTCSTFSVACVLHLQVRKELCRPQTSRYCQKFTNPFPEPVEKQNCHFEPKKICELQTRSRPRKAKRYSYTQDCTPIPRQLCDHVQTKKVVPVCVDVS